jgi:hypothetical protein
MTTTDTVLLVILTTLLSIWVLLGIALAIAALRLIANVRRVVTRAESVIDSVESAAEVFKNTEGRLALFKLIRNIVKMTKKARRNHK